jgi:RNA polymerase sigma-70 factor (ECF subfamily)
MTDELKEIWLPLAERFYRVAYHLLESREDAEDAVQELYLKLSRTPGRFSNVKDPFAFGVTVLRNICLDMIRRRQRRRTEELQEYMLLEECQECVTLETEGSDKKTVDRDRLRALMNQIDSLPRRQATILKMRAIEGLEYEEIARRTGLSQVNVRVHIYMARKALKKRMKV